MNQKHQCVLVTGASAGLGEEFARQIFPQASRLVLVARRGERLRALAEQLSQTGTAEVLVIEADLAASDDRERVAREVAAKDWTVDFLINNAGLGDYGEFTSSEWSRNEAMLRVNVEALTHLCHLFLPGMIAGGKGSIINISSLASTLPIPDFAVYAATKAYVSSFSEALRLEVREYGIEVLAVCPGPVKTEFGSIAAREEGGAGMPGGRAGFYVAKEQVVSEALRAITAGRPRLYPGFQVALAAAGISLLPLAVIRLIMGSRPRRQNFLEK